jgi:hypothetical protein
VVLQRSFENVGWRRLVESSNQGCSAPSSESYICGPPWMSVRIEMFNLKRGSKPCKGRQFFSPPKDVDRFGAHAASYTVGTRVPRPRLRRLGAETASFHDPNKHLMC